MTATSHEYHVDFAERESRTIQKKIGQGSWLFVMGRCWRMPGASGKDTHVRHETSEAGTYVHPTNRIVLRSLDGNKLFDFSDAPSQTYPTDPTKDPCGGATVELDPGMYLLERPAEGDERLTQMITALAGWQTQIFLLRRPSDKSGRRPPFGFSVFLNDRRDPGAPCPSFHGDNPDLRLSELARLGLTDARQVLADEVMAQIVDGKFRDPMLGLFGAHVLLLKANDVEKRKALAARMALIVANLRSLFGTAHPDVESLALTLSNSTGESSVPVFSVPPTLRRSWSLILEQSISQPDIVPDSSLTFDIANRVLTDEPWLVWYGRHLESKGGQEPLVFERADIRQPDVETTSKGGRESWPFETAEPDLIHEMLAALVRPTERGVAASKGFAPPSEEQQIRRLVRTLGLPRGRVEQLLKAQFGKTADLPQTLDAPIHEPALAPKITFAKAFAFVVGIDDYTGSGITPLPRTVRQDAEDIATLLKDPNRCGYAADHVRLLTGRFATRDAIRNAFDELKMAANPDSTVLLYFSCHGWTLPEGEYLMPANADATSAERIAATAISADEFSKRVSAIPAQKLLAVIDCCHAAGIVTLKGGSTAKSGLSGGAYDRLYTGRGRVVLAACAPDEQAVVLREGDRNSLFTAHLLEGLRGRAATDDGLIKVLGLFEYVQLQVTGRYRAQNPVLKADLQDNFPIALNNAREKGVSGRDLQAAYRYDAYIAHAEEDFDWVFDRLIPTLEKEGLRHTVSADAIGLYRVTSIEEAIKKSRYTLLVISSHYTADRLTKLAGILGQHQGIQAGTYQLIPVKIGEPNEEVRLGIQALVGVDLTRTGKRYEFELARLLKQLHQEPGTW
jgi:hypothetical protein